LVGPVYDAHREAWKAIPPYWVAVTKDDVSSLPIIVKDLQHDTVIVVMVTYNQACELLPKQAALARLRVSALQAYVKVPFNEI
jgi:hypothetical protein